MKLEKMTKIKYSVGLGPHDVLNNLVGKWAFINFELLSRNSELKPFRLKRASLLKYLNALKKEEKVFSAGRGWYSSLAEPLVLDPTPVKDVIAILKAQFPKLDVICWSTQQLVPYMQHLLAKHLIFVSTDRAGLETVGQALEEAGYTVHVNPGKPDAKKVVPGEKVVVLRPSVSQEPSAGPIALSEKVMVDLYIEAEKLNIMDGFEVGIILKSMLGSKRAEISKLFAYAKRRELELSRFLAGAESLFYGFLKKP
jgi:hypothetical protein